jgi:hypothetical protein
MRISMNKHITYTQKYKMELNIYVKGHTILIIRRKAKLRYTSHSRNDIYLKFDVL